MKKFFAIFLAVGALAIAACNKDDKPGEQVDLTELNALVAQCENLVAGATTATFPQSAIDNFKNVIATVKSAIPEVKTQAAANNLVAQLKAAKQVFEESEYGAIPADALAWALNFEDVVNGTSSITTTGKYNWKVDFVAGNDGVPTFVNGHKAGTKGLKFGEGGHLEIAKPVASVLESPTFSISCWVNTPINENNYILSWNKWDTWKFQTQSTNKAFLTVHQMPSDKWIDHDGNTEIPENEWHHVVATIDLTNGAMAYYLDGELTMLWNHENDDKFIPNQTFAPAPEGSILFIGLQEEGSDSYYKGMLDDLQFYTIALDGGQVSKLFNDQK